MRHVSLAVVFVALFTLPAGAEDAISPDMVTAIKAATVFVKIKAQDLDGSGSGFVVKTEGDTAYIVTNDHVVEPKDVEVVVRRTPSRSRRPYAGPGRIGPPTPMPPGVFPGGPRRPEPESEEPHYSVQLVTRTFANVAVTAVFQSGTKQEESAHGEVLAVDPEQDLAVVKVSGVKKMPKPIDLHQTKLSETMPIYVFGFPLGSELSVGKNSPAITVSKGSVSSLRMDDDGELSVVQLDAALNHGNSGGPVVDSKGRLVGVAEARIEADGSTNIGLAVPAEQVVKTLNGRIGKAALHVTKEDDGSATVHIQVGLIDPMNKVKAVGLDYIAAKAAPDTLKPTDAIYPLTSSHRLKLKIDKQVATGEFTLKQGLSEVSLLYQPICINGEGEKEVAKNVKTTLKVAAPVVASARPAASTPSANSVATASPNAGVTATPNRPIRVNRTPPARERVLGAQMGTPVRLTAPGKGLLVGLEVGLGKWSTNDIVSAFRPIFSNEKGEEVPGQQLGTAAANPIVLKAKAGYAIGAITARAMIRVDGFSVTFMKIDKDRLNPNDKYESDWVGGKGGGPEIRLGGDGTPVVGIQGWNSGTECTALGLIMAGANPAPVTAGSPASPANEVTDFTSKNGLFAIKFPAGERLVKQGRLLPIHNRPVLVDGMKKILNGGTTSLTAVSLTLSPAVMKDIPAEKRFDELRDAIVQQYFAKVVEETDITLDSLPGKRYDAEGPMGKSRLEMCMIDDAVWYTVVEGKTKEALASKEADAFSASFHLTEQGKAAAAKAAKGN